MSSQDKVKVQCDWSGCNLPVAYLKDGMLIITTHHHGQKHTTAVNLERLQEGDLTNWAKPDYSR